MSTIEILQRLDKETKAEVFVVGGFVRDYLRNKHNLDLDIVIRNSPLRNIKRFLHRYGTLKEICLSKTNDLFEINIILFKAFEDQIEAQITLPRKSKKQIPDLSNTLRQDVRFRDFKINALYLPINYTSKKDIIDLVGGKIDIIKKRLSSNGSPGERIKESPIRMLRAVSLAARTNYTIDNKLMEAIKINAPLINKCPMETIRTEFNKILMSNNPSKYLLILKDTGLLEHIAPEICACVDIKQDNKYHKYDVFHHLIYTVDYCDQDIVMRLAGLLHDVGKPETKKEYKEDSGMRISFHTHEMAGAKIAKNFLRRLKYDTEIIDKVVTLVRSHMFHYTREWTDAAVRKFIRRMEINEIYLTEDNISNFPLFKLRAAERLGNGLKLIAVTDRQKDFERKIIEVYQESNGLEIKDLNIDGNRIMEIFNLKPGIQIGNILKFLLDKILEDPNMNNELDLLKLVTEYLHFELNNKLTS